jgi:hypothetical protein
MKLLDVNVWLAAAWARHRGITREPRHGSISNTMNSRFVV